MRYIYKTNKRQLKFKKIKRLTGSPSKKNFTHMDEKEELMELKSKEARFLEIYTS